jgi:hypothetical protein
MVRVCGATCHPAISIAMKSIESLENRLGNHRIGLWAIRVHDFALGSGYSLILAFTTLPGEVGWMR